MIDEYTFQQNLEEVKTFMRNAYIHDECAVLITDEQIERWLEKPNGAFDSQTPKEWIRRGLKRRVINYLEQLLYT